MNLLVAIHIFSAGLGREVVGIPLLAITFTYQGEAVVAIEDKFVFTRFQLTGVIDVNTGTRQVGAITAVAENTVGHGRRRVDIGEHGTTQLAIQIHAFHVLLVHGVGKRQGDDADLVTRRIQHVVTIVEQTADFAATDLVGDVVDVVADLQRHIKLAGISRVNGGQQTVGVFAHHQRFALADKHVHATGILVIHRGEVNELCQLIKLGVTLVQQLIHLAAGGSGNAQLVVQFGDVARYGINLRGGAFQPRVQVVVLPFQIGVHAIQTLHQCIGLGDKEFTVGQTGRVINGGLQSTKIVIHGTGDTGGLGRQQVVQLVGKRLVNLGVAVGGRIRPDLAAQELVGDAGDVIYFDTGNALTGRKLRTLTAVAVGVDVGNVLANNRQRRLVARQGLFTDIQQTVTHGIPPLARFSACPLAFCLCRPRPRFLKYWSS